MAWTTPHTWPSPNDNPTAAQFNLDVRDNILFLYEKLQSGKVTITPSAANTPTSVTVTFDEPFATTPVVIASAETGVPGTTVLGVGAHTETTTNFVATVCRSNTTDTGIQWIAVVP